MDNVREMPKYTSHKQVWALKIKEIIGTTIFPIDEGYASFDVTEDYILRHEPKVGGYYVVYKDGYKSYSPSLAFEDGYAPFTPMQTFPDDLDSDVNCETPNQ